MISNETKKLTKQEHIIMAYLVTQKNLKIQDINLDKVRKIVSKVDWHTSFEKRKVQILKLVRG